MTHESAYEPRHAAQGTGARLPRHSTTHDEYEVSRAELLEALGIPAGHETALVIEPGGGLVIRVHRDTTPDAGGAAGREPPYPGQEVPWTSWAGHQACRHCQRAITLSPGGVWLDATGWTQCRKMSAEELLKGLRPVHEPELSAPQCRGAGLDEDGS
jgi:hypothetical protein